MGIQVLGDNVLIAETEKEEQTAGGIILTEAIDKGNKPGLVLAIGDYIQQDNADPENVFTKIEPGNRVFVKWSEAMPVNVEGQAAVLIDRNHIKAVLS
tara:strand:- start:645 stop:938 length:294 start_codon:yes stop_codon:yes gene_type:complete